MQPTHRTEDQNSTIENLATSGASRQHGEETAHSISPVRSPGPVSDDDASNDVLGTPSVLSAKHESRLRDGLTPSPSGRNRVAEYENTPVSAKPKKKNGGPAFAVVKKRGAGSDGGSQLLSLPNEVLTHTLAHLSPEDLTSVSMVSQRLHELVTTQHAWRAAFNRFFPGSESLHPSFDDEDLEEGQNTFIAARRDFTRLTALASWRSEYILRTRLLRSLARGKPVQASMQPSAPRSAQSHTASPIRLYNSKLYTTVNHLHATFDTESNKPVFTSIHGGDDVGSASMSDPSTGVVQDWGLTDPTTLYQFTDRYVGESLYGLGLGEIVGVPNPMDVSSSNGMIYAEGLPGGTIYFRGPSAMRGRSLPPSSATSNFDIGLPQISPSKESHCCVWIAKTDSIPTMTEGMIGLMSGSSLGVLTAYSLGSIPGREPKYNPGEVTAKWILCPGVPIISIRIDENYSHERLKEQRIWAVVLNALGEVFYLTAFPTPEADTIRPARVDPLKSEKAAWESGRSVFWTLVEPTRRTAKPDPYGESSVDGSYTPRSSWKRMYLSKEQLHAEARELEAFLSKKPKHIQAMCFGWDMRRRLEVDFANDDGNNAGESVVVIRTGQEEGSTASILRYTRTRPSAQESVDSSLDITSPAPSKKAATRQGSLFGGPVSSKADESEYDTATENTAAKLPGKVRPSTNEEWRMSTMLFGGLKSVQITASSLDASTFAVSTAREDPFLSFSAASSASSPTLTPLSIDGSPVAPQDLPGQRARLFAIGTSLGTIMVFNVRAAIPSTSSLTTSIEPMRIIHTDSPGISCIALSSLYLVSGGTDGLVQAWDPLASSSSPVRTLHSRFSSRARRRLAQAEASPQGVGINLFAAGAVFLDPDPTVLRGMVSLGTHILYWHFSGSAADAYRSHKRRLRRSERMSNSGGERYVPTPRAGGVRRFIENEKWDLHADEYREKQEHARMAGRYGTDLLGESATEEDLVAYAAMLSQEAFQADEERRQSLTPNAKASSRTSPAPESRHTPLRQSSVASQPADDFDADLEEAIKRSLALESSSPGPEPALEKTLDIPIKYAKSKKRSARSSPRPAEVGSSKADTSDDMDFALQISLAEERSRQDAEWERIEAEEAYTSMKGKGKDRVG